MIDRRWHSSTQDLRSFRVADCDNDHYLVVTEVRERLAVSKQAAQKLDGERFNLRKLNEFRRDRSTADHIFCIRQILEKKWEYNEAVHQLFIDFRKAYDSVSRAVLSYILIEFGIPTKLVRLIKVCLTETYSRVRVGRNLFDMFPIRNGLKQGDAVSLLLFSFVVGRKQCKRSTETNTANREKHRLV